MKIGFTGSPGLLILSSLMAALFTVGCTEDFYIDPGEKYWIEIEPPSVAFYEKPHSLVEGFDGCVIAGTVWGVFRTFDNGDTWEHSWDGLRSYVPVRALVKKEGGLLFAGLQPGGVFVSSDNGSSWRQVNNHLTNINVRSLALNSSGDLFAGTDGGEIFVTADDGGEWAECGSDLMSTDVCALVVDSSGVLYAGCRGDGVFSSHDDGGSWMEVNEGLQIGYVWDLALAADSRIIAVTDTGGIFLMDGEGGTWERVGSGITDSDISAVATGPGGEILAGTHGDGVLVSRDGGVTWERTGYGLNGRVLTALLFKDNSILAAGMYSGVFRSDDYGATWLVKGWEVQRYGQCLCFSPGDTLILGSREGLFITNDGGNSWIRSDDEAYCHVYDLAVHPSGYVLAVWNSCLYRSDDGCRTWVRKRISDTDEPSLTNVEVDSAGTIYTGSADEGLFRSWDGGESWEHIDIPHDYWTLNYIALKPDGTVFLVLSGNLYRSTDDCDTWEELWGRVRSIDIDSRGIVFVSDERGVRRSWDNGGKWEYVGTYVILNPLNVYPGVRLKISENDHILAWSLDGYLFHSTDGGNSWYRDSCRGYGGRLSSIQDAAFDAAGYAYLLGGYAIYRSESPDY